MQHVMDLLVVVCCVMQVVEQIRLEEKDERPDMEQLARATMGKFFNRQEYCKQMPGGNKGGLAALAVELT